MGSLVGKLELGSVHVSDFERSLKFYGETLGMKLAAKWDDLQLAVFETGGASFMVHFDPEGDTGRPPGGVSGLIFETDDVDQVYGDLKGKGIPIGDALQGAPWGVRLFTFYDPDDNEFVVWQQVE